MDTEDLFREGERLIQTIYRATVRQRERWIQKIYSERDRQMERERVELKQ